MKRRFTLFYALAMLLILSGVNLVQAQDLSNLKGPVLYDQTTNKASYTTQHSSLYYDFTTGLDTLYSSYISSSGSNVFADDFSVPAGGFDIYSVFIAGKSSADVALVKGVNIVIMNDNAGAPGDVVQEYLLINDFQYLNGDFIVYLPQKLSLAEGNYWLGTSVVSDKSSKFSWNWYMENNTDTIGIAPSHFYSYSADNSTNWTSLKDKNTSPYQRTDLTFSLHSVSTNDLALLEISSPVTGESLGTDNVSIRLRNIGTAAQSNFPVKFKLNDLPEVSETITATINPGDELVYTFTTSLDLSEVKIHTVNASVALAGDENTANDALSVEVENYGTVYRINNYDAGVITACEGHFTDEGGIDEGIPDVANYTTTIKPGGLNQRTVLTFNSYAISYKDTISIYDGTSTDAPLIGKWRNSKPTAPIVATNASGALTFEFEGIYNRNRNGWDATISCIDADAKDLAILEIITPITGEQLTDSEAVSVVIKNFGYEAQSNFDISFQVDANTAVTETITESIAAGETLTHTFTTGFANLTEVKDFVIKASANLVGDQKAENDAVETTVTNYGVVYRISNYADGEIIAGSGKFTDDGGVGDNYSKQVSYTTTLKPDVADHAVILNFTDIKFNYGTKIEIYNGLDVNASLIGVWDNYSTSELLNKFIKATNVDGALTAVFTTGTSLNRGFVAEISTTLIPDNDLAINSVSVDDNVVFANNEISVSLNIANIGLKEQTKNISFTVNDEVVESINTGNIGSGKDSLLVIAWTPVNPGDFNLKFSLPADDGTDQNNVDSLGVTVLAEGSLFESFEDGVFPSEFWIAGPTWTVDATKATHGSNSAKKGYGDNWEDTLVTPLLDIKVGDAINLDILAMDGGIEFGWIDGKTGIYTKIDTGFYYGYNKYNHYQVNISDAAGVNKLAFVGIPNVYIDKLYGPSLFYHDKNIEAKELITEPFAIAGDTSQMNVVLRNLGKNSVTAEAYTIDLYRKGNPDILLKSFSGVALEHLQSDTLTIEYSFDFKDQVSVCAKVSFEGDGDTENDATAYADINVHEKGTQITTAGNGNTLQDKVPMKAYDTHSVSQIIYSQERIGKLGNISGISFSKDFAKELNGTYFKVLIGHTDSTSLEKGWIKISNLTQVYEDTLDISAGVGNVYIPFSTDFLYEGGNLAISIYRINDSYAMEQKFLSTDTTIAVSRYHSAYNKEIDITALTTEGSSVNYYPNTNFFIDSKVGTIAGKLIDDKGNLVEGADILLEGFDTYQIKTDAEGMFTISDVVINQTYKLTVKKADLETYIDEAIELIAITTDLGEIKLAEIQIPVSIIAESNENSSLITWTSSELATFEDPIYCNDVLEQLYVAEPQTEMWAGNRIPVSNPGTIVGAYLVGFTNNNYYANKDVTMEMLDTTFKVIAVSEPFKIPNGVEIYVDMPNVSYTGDFYLMVHWDNHEDYTYGIGLDTDGNFKNGYVGNPETGFAEAGGAFTISPAFYTNNQKTNTKVFEGYNIYRGLLNEMNKVNTWKQLNTEPVVPVEGVASYEDQNWPIAEAGMYTYAVKSVYTSDSSEVSFSNILKVGLESEVSIVVNSNGAHPQGAEIVLTNESGLAIHSYTAVLDAESTIVFPIVERGTYSLVVSHDTYESYTEASIVINEEMHKLSVELTEVLTAPFSIKIDTENGTGEALVSWNGFGEDQQLILDDGSYETGLFFQAGNTGGLGNKYEVDYQGTIQSIDVFGLPYGNQSEQNVTINIYDEAHNVLSTSKPFTIPADEFYTVEFDEPVAFDGTFYAIVHWEGLTDTTNVLALDLNGEHAGTKIATFESEEGLIDIASVQANLDGVFAIRPTVSKAGKSSTKNTVSMNSNNTNVTAVFSIAELESVKYATGTSKSGKTYNVYLNDMATPIASDITDLFYQLTGIETGSHEVGVSTNYVSGESEITKLTFSYVNTTSVEDINESNVSVYPNPTVGILNIDNVQNSDILIYSIDGLLMNTYHSNEINTKLDIHHLENGSYMLIIKKQNETLVKRVILKN